MKTFRHSRAGGNPAKIIELLTVALIANIALPAPANAAELRRLFYTPQQRAQLERQQVTGESDEGGKHNFIVVNGVIQKQDGNRIVWINGTQQPTTYSNEKAPSTESITVPGMSKPVQVKVGQRLILDTPAPVKADEIKSDKPDPVNPAAKEDD